MGIPLAARAEGPCPSCLFEPLWSRFAVLVPERPAVVATHPPGCHRPRVPDRVVFEHVVAALVHGSGYERIASPGCSDRTIRRRVKERAAPGPTERLHAPAPERYARPIGLDPDHPCAAGCLTTAPGGGERAGRSPVDRGRPGLQRAAVADGEGVPLHPVSAPANRHDSPLLRPTRAGLDTPRPLPEGVTVHPDRAFDTAPCRALLDELGCGGEIARTGAPAPLRVGRRRVVERPQAWMHGHGKLRRCTERDARVVDPSLCLAAAGVVARALIRQARQAFRRPGKPTTTRLK